MLGVARIRSGPKEGAPRDLGGHASLPASRALGRPGTTSGGGGRWLVPKVGFEPTRAVKPNGF